MNRVTELLNSTESREDGYNLYVDIKESSLPEYVDIRFYSTFSGAKDPKAEQTKWMTTIPIDSLDALNNTITDYLRLDIKSKL